MATQISLTLQEQPALLSIVYVPPRHLQVLWGLKKLPFSYANKAALDRHIVAFSRNVVAGATPPTVTINPNWWDLEYHLVVSPRTAATEVEKFTNNSAAVAEQAGILISLIDPLTFVRPLLTAPYLTPAAAYTLLAAQVAAWIWDAPLAPLMKCLRVSLSKLCSRISFLSPLNMSKHITYNSR